MLIVPLSGENIGYWSHLGCSAQNAIIFCCEGLVEGCTRRNIKMYIQYVLFYFVFLYLIHVIKVSYNINSLSLFTHGLF